MVSSCWYNSNRANLLEYTCVVISTRDAHQNGAGWLVTRCERVCIISMVLWWRCMPSKPTYGQHKMIFTKREAFVTFVLSLEVGTNLIQ